MNQRRGKLGRRAAPPASARVEEGVLRRRRRSNIPGSTSSPAPRPSPP